LDLTKAPVEAGNILGVASGLIQSEPRLKPVVDLLLGHVIVVKDRKNARTILASRDWRDMPDVRIATVKGELFCANGPVITGASGKSLLSRPRKKLEIKSVYEKAASEMLGLDTELAKIESVLTDLRDQEQSYTEKYHIAINTEKEAAKKLSQQELQNEKLQRDIAWHKDQRSRYQIDLESETLELTKVNQDLETIQGEISSLKHDLDGENAQLDTLPLEELQEQASYWNTKSAVIEQALSDARNRQREKLDQLNQVVNNLSAIITRAEQLDHEINILNESIDAGSSEELEISKLIDELGKIVNPHEAQLSALEKEQNSLIITDAEARQRLRLAEQKYTQAKINLVHHQESFESLRRHIEDDFGLVSFDYPDSISGPKPLPLDGMVEELPVIKVMPAELEETIRQQKAQMRRMGAINPEAQNEYKEVKERFEFLSTQVEDLNKAEGDIKEVIAELDIMMEREFRRTFDAVAQEFRQIFTRLFGGGSARLALTDPENMTETGIDIEARLPGRREQGLSLLSGGERSLTATALVFALLRVSPTPFCILDEVDAMLDEANVGRFRDLLTELSEQTQFIVITHNRNTVQAASIIYGVTMGRDSASQVISLKMDELGEEFGV
jgi:chromosome segregation protein